MSASPTPVIPQTASSVTLCGLPTTSVTLQHGAPAPIVWTCEPSAAATWRSLHSNPDVATSLTVTLTVDELSSVSSLSAIPASMDPVTLCDLPTAHATWKHGTPTPIFWTCDSSAAASWNSVHSKPHAATTLTVTRTAAGSSSGVVPAPSNSGQSMQPSSTIQPIQSSSDSQSIQLSSESQSIQPSPSSQSIQPSSESQSIQPSPSSQSIKPSSESQSIQPSPSSQSIQPSSESQSIQPSPSSQSIQPSSESQSIQPSPSSQAIQPSSESQSIQPSLSSQSTQPSSSSQSTQSSWSTSTSKRSTTSAPHSTTTTTYSRNTQSVVAQVTMKAPTKVCTEDNLSVSTKMLIPTGSIIIRADGWGKEGTIWNITTGRGAILNNMNAQCQGSSCTGINGDGNKNEDGIMKRRPDGSWYLNVTANMQASLSISGVLAVDPKAQRRSHQILSREQTKYPFEIYGYPPCPREVALECGSKEFYSRHQWRAFGVDDFMKDYLDKHDLNNMDEFRMKAMHDFGDENKARCDIAGGGSCEPPGIHDCEFARNNQTNTKGLLMTKGAVAYTNYMQMLYEKVKDSSARISHGINEAILSFYQPAAKSRWSAMMSLSGALIGLLTAAAVMIAVFAPEGTAAIIAAAATAASIGGAGGVGIASAVHDLKGNPEKTDTLFKESTKYTTAADGMIDSIDNALVEIYKSDKVGQDGIASILKNGAWSGSEVTKFFNGQGNGANMTSWFERVMLSTVITQIMNDNNFYLLHVPYGTSVPYKDKVKFEDKEMTKQIGFTKEECEKHWRGNPSWKYYATCDQTYGPDGDLGMTLFVRPYKGEKTAWTLDEIVPFNYGGVKFTGIEILQSALWGQAQHGFNYTFLDRDFSKDLTTQGLSSAQEMYNDLPFNQPGLFPIPVCVVNDLVNVPGVGQVMADWQDRDKQMDYYHTTDACSCKDAYAMFANGTRGNFIDFVNDDVADSLKDCKQKGDYRAAKVKGHRFYFGDPKE